LSEELQGGDLDALPRRHHKCQIMAILKEFAVSVWMARSKRGRYDWLTHLTGSAEIATATLRTVMKMIDFPGFV
jgi:hypothetical protein